MKLIFATANRHKAEEIKQIIGGKHEILLPSDLGYTTDIEETGTTLEENAEIKARTIFEQYAIPVFADDTGLEVTALNGAPGVWSARYAGANATYKNNCDKLLNALEGVEDRSAAFKTVICFIDQNGMAQNFVGEAHGSIITEFRGDAGFGYDPIFLPANSSKTFAEMSSEEKNALSHRGKAIRAFAEFINR